MTIPVACGNFKREAQFLARVSFDTRFVVNIHELIEDEIGLFIVEEYVDAHWLESLLSKRHASINGTPTSCLRPWRRTQDAALAQYRSP